MAFTPHYIGQADGAIGGSVVPEPLQLVVKIGTVLWGVADLYTISTFRLYKSGDSGANWTGIADLPYITDGDVIYAHLVVYHEGMIRVIAAWPPVADGPTGPFTLMTATIDPAAGSPAWTAWTTLGFTSTVANRSQGLRMYADVRPSDGSLLFAYSELDGTQESTRVRTLLAGTWTDLGLKTPPAGFNGFVSNGLINSTTGLAYLFFNIADQSTDDTTLQMCTVSSANTVGAFQNIGAMGTAKLDFLNYNRGVIRSDGTLCVGFAVVTSGAADLSVAFGDVSADPFTPVWTTAAVTAVGDYSSFSGAGLSEIDTTLYVHFTAGPGVFPSSVTLYKSSWSGSAWGSRVVWIDPATLTPSVTAVIDFQLVPGFPHGNVGIVLDAGFDTVGPFFEFLVYGGPSSGRYTFAYTGKGSPLYNRVRGTHSRSAKT